MISAIPAAISVIIAQFFVNETKNSHLLIANLKREQRQKDEKQKEEEGLRKVQNNIKILGFLKEIQLFDARLRFFIIVSSIFAFANFNLSFFILKAKATEISDTNILLLYTLFNVFYAAVSYPFGVVSDRIGRDKVVMMDFAVFIVATLGFAFFSTSML